MTEPTLHDQIRNIAHLPPERRIAFGPIPRDWANLGSGLHVAFYELDVSDLHTSQSVIKLCISALRLPVWTGRNWDALIDSLGECTFTEKAYVAIFWKGYSVLSQRHPRVAKNLLEACRHSLIEDGWGYEYKPKLLIFENSFGAMNATDRGSK